MNDKRYFDVPDNMKSVLKDAGFHNALPTSQSIAATHEWNDWVAQQRADGLGDGPNFDDFDFDRASFLISTCYKNIDLGHASMQGVNFDSASFYDSNFNGVLVRDADYQAMEILNSGQFDGLPLLVDLLNAPTGLYGGTAINARFEGANNIRFNNVDVTGLVITGDRENVEMRSHEKTPADVPIEHAIAAAHDGGVMRCAVSGGEDVRESTDVNHGLMATNDVAIVEGCIDKPTRF